MLRKYETSTLKSKYFYSLIHIHAASQKLKNPHGVIRTISFASMDKIADGGAFSFDLTR